MYFQFLLLCLATSALAFSITRGSLFKPLREWPYVHKQINELFTCPFCMSHWIALILALCTEFSIFPGLNWFLNMLLSWFSILGGAILFLGAGMQLLHVQESIIKRQAATIEELRKKS